MKRIVFKCKRDDFTISGTEYSNIGKIEAPILIIHGNNDKIVNISYAEKAVKTAKSGKLSVLAGAGHGFNKRQIKTANKTMDVFLKNR